jgi:hypothetical protein
MWIPRNHNFAGAAMASLVLASLSFIMSMISVCVASDIHAKIHRVHCFMPQLNSPPIIKIIISTSIATTKIHTTQDHLEVEVVVVA